MRSFLKLLCRPSLGSSVDTNFWLDIEIGLVFFFSSFAVLRFFMISFQNFQKKKKKFSVENFLEKMHPLTTKCWYSLDIKLVLPQVPTRQVDTCPRLIVLLHVPTGQVLVQDTDMFLFFSLYLKTAQTKVHLYPCCI